MKIFKLTLPLFFFLLAFINSSYAKDFDIDDLKDELQDMKENLKNEIDKLPEASNDIEKQFDEAIKSLFLGITSISNEDVDLGEVEIFDQLNVFENLAETVSATLPKEISHNMEDLDMDKFTEAEKNLLTSTMSDLKNLKLEKSVEISESIERINQTSFKITNTIQKLEEINDSFAIIDFERFKKNMASELNVDVGTLMDGAENQIIISSNDPADSLALTSSTDDLVKIDQISEDIGKTTEEISQVTQEVSNVAEEVQAVTENLNEVVEEITEATTEIAEAAESITEEASDLANWISSGKFDMSLATNFATHVDWDNWDPGNSTFYKLEHQSNAIIEAMAEVNDAINCNDGTCVFDNWKDVRDLEDYNKIMSFCDDKPSSGGGFSVNGVEYSYSDCP